MKLSLPLRCKVGAGLQCYKAEAALYFHWPFCKNLCTFCNFNKYVKSDVKFGSNFDRLLSESLLKETVTVLKQTGITEVKSIYFGGGTPTLAPASTISSLIKCVKRLTNVQKDVEVTVECNPSSSNMLSLLEHYAGSGVNRVSVGLQSLSDTTLQLLGRDHTVREAVELLKDAQQVFGVGGVTADLLFGKPNDTEESWAEELGIILDYNPSHLSLYELTLENGTKLYKQVQSGEVKLPHLDATASMYQTAIDLLKEHGLERYEVSSFARQPNFQSAHNASYWNGSQYVGIGPGAHSRFYVKDHPYREARIQCLDPRTWRKMVEEVGSGTQIQRKQNKLDVLTELLATSLRTKKGLVEDRWNIFEPDQSLMDLFQSANSVKRLCHDGFLRWNATGNLCATDKGLNVIDAILPNLINVLYDEYGELK